MIWPLFHDLQSRCRFNPSFWTSYCDVNGKFANAVELVASPNDFVWVHDYHLMMLASVLRDRGFLAQTAYFHHIPFHLLTSSKSFPGERKSSKGCSASVLFKYKPTATGGILSPAYVGSTATHASSCLTDCSTFRRLTRTHGLGPFR